jgi:hypothetical protein
MAMAQSKARFMKPPDLWLRGAYSAPIDAWQCAIVRPIELFPYGIPFSHREVIHSFSKSRADAKYAQKIKGFPFPSNPVGRARYAILSPS